MVVPPTRYLAGIQEQERAKEVGAPRNLSDREGSLNEVDTS